MRKVWSVAAVAVVAALTFGGATLASGDSRKGSSNHHGGRVHGPGFDRRKSARACPRHRRQVQPR